jgi:hypothetical protein
VGICNAFAVGAVSLGRRRCPGPLLGLVFSACSGVVFMLSLFVFVLVFPALFLSIFFSVLSLLACLFSFALVVAFCVLCYMYCTPCWVCSGLRPSNPTAKSASSSKCACIAFTATCSPLGSKPRKTAPNAPSSREGPQPPGGCLKDLLMNR